ncbi:hypothetical protein StoSoilA2_39670 [Arthrobacter sp. StoSoilA2]|nr:hypothetical protein StoSoilA2_39670 [Arthrobacter sp. StoSoilA2]
MGAGVGVGVDAGEDGVGVAGVGDGGAGVGDGAEAVCDGVDVWVGEGVGDGVVV